MARTPPSTTLYRWHGCCARAHPLAQLGWLHSVSLSPHADDFEGTKKWQNMAVLVAMVAVYRTLAYVHMVYKHTGRH